MSEDASPGVRYGGLVTPFVVGPTSLIWQYSGRLQWLALWGCPTRAHLTSAIRTLGCDMRGGKSASIVDVRRVEAVDPALFELVTRFVRLHVDELGKRVSAQALLRPDGVVGATAAGFYRLLAPLHPVEVFTDPTEALSWLGVMDLFQSIAEFEDVLDRLARSSKMLSELRDRLNRGPGKTSLNKVAAALGMSGRALQRRLRELNTTFRTEHNAAQIQAAKELLLSTNYDIKHIAFEVGCASAAGFSVLFRRLEGQSPRDWRDRYRSASYSTPQGYLA